MPLRAAEIRAETVRETLRDIRFGKPLEHSSLLHLRAVSAQMRRHGLAGRGEQREWALARLLETIVWAELNQLRGPDRAISRSALTVAAEPELVIGDFRSGHIELEAWSMLYFRYFGSSRIEMRELADRVGVTRKTLTRRLARGHQLLSRVLRERERNIELQESGRSGLPVPLTQFVGRDREIAKIRELLAESRLVTLTGSGGIGKSRLAVHLARDLKDSFPDGVVFVDLAPIDDAFEVPYAFLAALGFRAESSRSPVALLADYLERRHCMLVADNCEHLVAPCTELLEQILNGCPRVQILATSREQLHVAGGATFSVPPMLSPNTDAPTAQHAMHYDAPRLFGLRAAAAKPRFALTDDTAPSVSAICSQLEGLPLAIELAAAKIRHLTLEQIEERLDDRFELLRDRRTGSRRSHETLRATVDWSYQLLDQPERQLLRRLSVFRDGWTLEGAEEVAPGGAVNQADVLTLLESLEAKSMIQVRYEGATTRYHMFETVRSFASERLHEAGESGKWEARHTDYYERLVSSWEPDLPMDQGWLATLDREHRNVVRAIQTSVERGDVEAALRLWGRASYCWYVKNRIPEALEIGRPVIAAVQPNTEHAALADALRGYGTLLLGQRELDAAEGPLAESLSLYKRLGDEAGAAWSELKLGELAEYRGNLDAATGRYAAAAETFKSVQNVKGIIAAEQDLGIVAGNVGDYAAASEHHNTALELAQEGGFKRGQAASHRYLGILCHYQSDFEAAAQHYELDLAYHREIGDRLSIAVATQNLGTAAEALGNVDRARRLYREAVDHLEAAGGFGMLPRARLALGNGERLAGNLVAAREVLEQALADAERRGLEYVAARANLWLAWVDLDEGEIESAQRRATVFLSVCRDQPRPRGVAYSLAFFARVSTETGDFEDALRLAGAAVSHYERIGESISDETHALLDEIKATAADALPPQAVEDALNRGRRMPVDEAVALCVTELPE